MLLNEVCLWKVWLWSKFMQCSMLVSWILQVIATLSPLLILPPNWKFIANLRFATLSWRTYLYRSWEHLVLFLQRFIHNIRTIQGSLIVSSFVSIILGFSKGWGNFTRWGIVFLWIYFCILLYTSDTLILVINEFLGGNQDAFIRISFFLTIYAGSSVQLSLCL